MPAPTPLSDDQLLLYPYSRGRPAIRPAESKRQWMDDSPQSYAYRCLPLTIANTHGWEILCGVERGTGPEGCCADLRSG